MRLVGTFCISLLSDHERSERHFDMLKYEMQIPRLLYKNQRFWFHIAILVVKLFSDYVLLLKCIKVYSIIKYHILQDSTFSSRRNSSHIMCVIPVCFREAVARFQPEVEPSWLQKYLQHRRPTGGALAAWYHLAQRVSTSPVWTLSCYS